MFTESGLVLFQLGAVMLIGFIGAFAASKLNQSVIIGYIVAGLLIGPNLSFDFLKISYSGIVQDTVFINELSHIGLVLLLFFVGLEFSISKLKKTKTPATLLAIINLGFNMIAGFLIGTILGWSIIDTLFLTGVVAMSSASITAKTLMELERLANPETEFLLGMVIIQDFLSMLLLTVAGGLIVRSDGGSGLTWVILGVVAFYAFFALLGIFVIPRVVKYFKKIKSDELFILFALGMAFLSAAMADFFNVPEIIGAFFIGMIFAETELSHKLASVLKHLRDAFVAIFFLAFGMLIDPSAFMDILPILLLAVPAVLINDILFTSALAFLMGFSKRQSANMSTAICGRGAESVLYSKVGTDAITSNPQFTNAYGGTLLNPFAGVFCFTMSLIAIPIIRRSYIVENIVSKALPSDIKWSTKAVQRVIKMMVMPQSLPMMRQEKKILYLLIGYALFIPFVIFTTGWWHVGVVLLIPVVAFVFWRFLETYVQDSLSYVNMDTLGIRGQVKEELGIFVTQFLTGFFTIFLLMFAVWQYFVFAVPLIGIVWITGQILMLRGLHKKIGPATPVEVESEVMEPVSTTIFDTSKVSSSWSVERSKKKSGGPKPYSIE